MTKYDVVFEEATESDALALASFLEEVSSETSFIFNDSESFSVADLKIALALSLNRLNRICLLAKIDDDIIGVVNVTSSDSYAIDHVGDLFIAVKQAYSGHGIGHCLMELACDWAEHSPLIRRLELTVQARNRRAIKLYQDFDFVVEATKTAAFKLDDETYLDVLLMSKMIGNKK